MTNDPYATPSASGYETLHAGGGLVSQAAIQQLVGTRPWVIFFAVMMFIGSGFLVLGALGMAMMGGMSSITSSRSATPFPAGIGFALAAVYLVLAVVYVFPGVKLVQYASAISRLVRTRQESDLVMALDRQRSFWKLVGIMMIVMIGLYVLFIIGVVLSGVAAASRF